MNCKKWLYSLAVLFAAFVIILPSLVLADDPAPPVVTKSSWGRIKVLYRGDDSTTAPEVSTFGLKKQTVGPASSSRFSWGYCTWYAATEFDKVAPAPGCNWGGNAAQWWNNAASQMWYQNGHYYRWICPNASPTSAATWNVPNGTIVVWNNGGAGHVAVVRSWGQNGISIQEMNWVGFGKVSSAFLNWFQVSNRSGYRFVGYIMPRQVVSW